MARDPGPLRSSVAGIVDDPDTRSRIIPESRRADGSIRKERKVKPGFTPAEDIGKFRPSRMLRAQAEAESIKQTKSVPGYEPAPIEAARKAMARTTTSPPSNQPTVWDLEWRKSPSKVTAGGDNAWRSSQKSTSKSSSNDSPSWRRGAKVATEEVPDDWEHDERGEVLASGKTEDEKKEQQSGSGLENKAKLEGKDADSSSTESLKDLATQALDNNVPLPGHEQINTATSLEELTQNLKSLEVNRPNK